MLRIGRRLWTELRDGFWFLPLMLLAAHIGMAVALTYSSLAENRPWMARWPHLFGAGADGAREMLSTVAGSMMTVVGVTLSMTVVTLALASSQYTSRILRNFIRDRMTQVVLGVFAGIYAYCLVVLRTIRAGEESGFVPGLAVLLAVILAVVGIILLIYFIHHIATSIQASFVIASVAAETIAAVERLYPRDATSSPPDDYASPSIDTAGWSPIVAPADGYVVRIDFTVLDQIARSQQATVRTECAVGEFVIKGSPVMSVPAKVAADDDMMRELVGAIDIARHRTVENDVGFGLRQLVDISLRALSPGINDTTTAIMCIDYLAAVLTRLATRSVNDYTGSVKQPRAVMISRPQTFARLVGEAFDQIREAGRGNLAVLTRLVEAHDALGAVTVGADRRQLLLEHVDVITETAARSIESPTDRDRFFSIASLVRTRLASETVC